MLLFLHRHKGIENLNDSLWAKSTYLKNTLPPTARVTMCAIIVVFLAMLVVFLTQTSSR